MDEYFLLSLDIVLAFLTYCAPLILTHCLSKCNVYMATSNLLFIVSCFFKSSNLYQQNDEYVIFSDKKTLVFTIFQKVLHDTREMFWVKHYS